jgi:hypothetical protein
MDTQSFVKIPPNELAACCKKHAEKWGVSAKVHPQDYIFRFLLTNPTFADMNAAISYYFNTGHESAEKLNSVLRDDLSVDVTKGKEMLEFASGYGCVTRHWSTVLPAFAITSSDIHPEANSFIIDELGGQSVQSSSVPELFDPRREYDVVFALSFFSHIPVRTWSRWLKALFKTLHVGGSMIFTTHGLISLRKIPFNASLDEEGFYFKAESEQDDLDTSEYGITVTSPKFVVHQIEALDNCELRLARTGFWWGHQDLYIVGKI